MKKILFITLIPFATLLTAHQASAQSALPAYTAKPGLRLSFSTPEEAEPVRAALPVAVSERLQQQFRKAFTTATGIQWSPDRNGYAVSFTADGIRCRAFLSKRGHCQSLIRYYGEDRLPAAVRHQVKSTYYDEAITGVTEVQHYGQTAYLVTVSGKTGWKVVRVQDGDMSLWEDHPKQ
ncbi:MAG TPA: hypothetical protein VHK69_19670 [Chitinophagaceae bacterium]|jgi:hypothetical protein|nr:hypothetical protein [Chitinophagaceae bacterium]